MKIIKKNIYFVFFFLFTFSNAYSQWFIDVETGWVFSGYNNVRIPRDTGSQFSLSKDLKTDSSLFFRLRLGYEISQKHTLSVFVAPLSLNASGSVNKSIRFFEEYFPAEIPLKAVYRFNSYRLTYRYNFLRNENWRIGIGLTAKIRDAAVSVEGNNKKSEKTNVGFVPLINFLIEWDFAKNLSLLLTGDALAAPQGRAEDVLLALQFHLSDNLTLKAGYRILEGGANVEEVYNFALIHFVCAGATFRF
ncbi:MAG: hypothetical protein JSV96_04170 [Candidatus Aminicenantes bacterium]|nr:MAG: hypothetical protein JSV96_04170 [Candidatus Aminicenantes bacterium]